jgi:glucose-1-phosphate adenylyltransferase
MGVYVFDRELLRDCLEVDAADECSSHDLTRDLLPLLIRASGVQAHVFRAPATGASYWRDVDSVDGYWRANMDLLRDGPKADLSSAPFAAHVRPAPCIVGGGSAVRSIVASGCTIAGSVRDSVLSTDCEVRSGAVVESSIVLPGARIGRGCRIHRAIIGAGCVVPDDTVIGENARRDAERFDVSPGGVVVVTADRAERAARPGLH